MITITGSRLALNWRSSIRTSGAPGFLNKS
jgi:hypothetical protein